ncbi:unnamed protein product [Blepharisma stoltei]|uniref:Uncharacterized protein n=1 Tax=Blepharisma stoltei TaxID=1481888 RepID=A0AAU9I9P9_9CILI|nr:unnamed protein product [Blepharisma stoltei]
MRWEIIKMPSENDSVIIFSRFFECSNSLLYKNLSKETFLQYKDNRFKIITAIAIKYEECLYQTFSELLNICSCIYHI